MSVFEGRLLTLDLTRERVVGCEEGTTCRLSCDFLGGVLDGRDVCTLREVVVATVRGGLAVDTRVDGTLERLAEAFLA